MQVQVYRVEKYFKRIITKCLIVNLESVSGVNIFIVLFLSSLVPEGLMSGFIFSELSSRYLSVTSGCTPQIQHFIRK